MRCTAGTHVHIPDTDDPHLSFDLDLAPIIHGSQFFLSWIQNLHRNIIPDCLIGQCLHFPHLLRCQFSVKIHGGLGCSQMKSYIVISIQAMNDAGQHMLSCVLLHSGKTFLIVQFTFYFCSHGNRGFCLMIDHSIFLMGIRHFDSIDPTLIPELSASFRKK